MTLALGIGAVTVIYSLLRNVLLDPFPYPHSDRMVDVVVKDASDRIIRGPAFPAPEFLDYQEQTQAFEDVVGTGRDSMHWVSDAGAERLTVAWMTPNGFAFLGVPPLLGRVFGVADAAPGAPPVAVLNHRTWMTLFGGDPGVVGRSIVLNGEARTIIGVMPPRFEWNVADLWIPGALSRADDPGLARCQTIRPRLAPSAARIVISRSRAVARASSMFATLQQANHEQQAHRRRSRPRGISLKKLSVSWRLVDNNSLLDYQSIRLDSL